ncbi:TIGR02679 family protein [Kitasatospora sp. NPDC004799]|uniref:TIGR02679 family protein n=1 Tax=Kitasatospora sp. NPDC004799 TaxID=3154460 RepID=UPI0033B2AE2D
MSTDVPRLQRLIGSPELTWLLDRARRRMESGRALDGTVTLTGATEAERAAASRLLGRALRPGRSLSVSLAAVDQVLRASGASPDGLAEAVVALTGPVVPRQETADRLARAWDSAFAPLAAVVAARPEFADWYAALHATGLVRRLARSPEEAAPLLAGLAGLLPHLPVSPPRSLGAFAAEHAGGAHALDHGPLATLTLDAVRALTATPPGEGAQGRRDTWAAGGLLLDELSSQVVALNLPGDPDTATGRALDALGAVGQPAVLTLRQLLRDAPVLPQGGTAYVCENPAVVLTAADHLGPGCPPLICLQGQPSTAALHLLKLYAEAGWNLHYHGDFDWGGIRIATRLLDHVPWTPWRYATADYRAALDAHPSSAALTGTPTEARWDPNLSSELLASGRRIEEELVLDDLIADLAGRIVT